MIIIIIIIINGGGGNGDDNKPKKMRHFAKKIHLNCCSNAQQIISQTSTKSASNWLLFHRCNFFPNFLKRKSADRLNCFCFVFVLFCLLLFVLFFVILILFI